MHAGGHRFDSDILHCSKIFVNVAVGAGSERSEKRFESSTFPIPIYREKFFDVLELKSFGFIHKTSISRYQLLLYQCNLIYFNLLEAIIIYLLVILLKVT